VNLIGSPHTANKAKDLIMEIVESDTRGPQQNEPAPNVTQQYHAGTMHEPSKINESIRVPSEAVGMIIGKGGETIRDMQNATGCKINVSQASGADVEREIGLVGSRQAIDAAKRAIQEKVDAVVNFRSLSIRVLYLTCSQREKGSSRGGRQDNPVPAQYGQQSGYQNYAQSYSQPQQNTQTGQVSSADSNAAADPYAIYGGYQNYMAMWYAALASGARNPGAQDNTQSGPGS
jgi:far upstream element-binding protein